MHRVSEDHIQRATLALVLALQTLEHVTEVGRLALELGENLETVMMVADVFLVDGQHRQ